MKKVICYIFALFLSFFAFLFFTLTIVRMYTVSESNFFRILDKNNYYESTVIQYNRVLKQNARPTNFPVELFDNFIQTEDAFDDMQKSIKAEFDGKAYKIDTTNIKERLKQITDKYIKDEGIQVDQRTKEAVQKFIDINAENYDTMLRFPFFQYISKGFRAIHSVYLIAAPILLILCAVLIYLQERMHRSRRRRRRWHAYSMIGTGLLLFVFPIILLGTKTINRIQLDPKYIYDIFVELVNGSLGIMAILGIILILGGICLTYLKVKELPKKRKGPRKYDKAVNTSRMSREVD